MAEMGMQNGGFACCRERASQNEMRRVADVVAIQAISGRTVSNWASVKLPHPRYLVDPAKARSMVIICSDLAGGFWRR